MKIIIYRFLQISITLILSFKIASFIDELNPSKHEFDGKAEINLLLALFISVFLVVLLGYFFKKKNK